MSDQPISPQYVLSFEKSFVKIEEEIRRLEASQQESGRDYSDIVAALREQLHNGMKQAYSGLTPWENVLVARHPRRPQLRDYIRLICKDFCELHGDRLYGDDKAIVCGFGRLAGHKVLLVGHQKGRDTKEKLECNFGCAHPEGYRKALLKMKMAAKFGVPIVCLVDTQGAYPGIGAEERGIASAIAVNLFELSRLPTKIIAAVIGEGGSGGALGIAIADHLALMQHAYYSVISPEGCAAILWKSGEHAPKAAAALKMTPAELKRLNLIDSIIPEPLGGAHRHPEAAARNLEAWIGSALEGLKDLPMEELLVRRYERLRSLGSFFTGAPEEAKPTPQRARRSAPAAG